MRDSFQREMRVRLKCCLAVAVCVNKLIVNETIGDAQKERLVHINQDLINELLSVNQ